MQNFVQEYFSFKLPKVILCEIYKSPVMKEISKSRSHSLASNCLWARSIKCSILQTLWAIWSIVKLIACSNDNSTDPPSHCTLQPPFRQTIFLYMILSPTPGRSSWPWLLLLPCGFPVSSCSSSPQNPPPAANKDTIFWSFTYVAIRAPVWRPELGNVFVHVFHMQCWTPAQGEFLSQ